MARSDCRVDGVEKWMDWLPDREDPVYGRMYELHESGRLSGRREGNVRCFLLNRQIFTGLSERNGMRSGSACFPDS